MPTKHPRLNVVLEPPVYRSVKQLARRDGMSLSLKARDLIRDALELYEDAYWVQEAKVRDATFRRDEALTHEQMLAKWGGGRSRRRRPS